MFAATVRMSVNECSDSFGFLCHGAPGSGCAERPVITIRATRAVLDLGQVR